MKVYDWKHNLYMNNSSDDDIKGKPGKVKW